MRTPILLLMLLVPAAFARAAATVVDDTFAKGSRDQDIAENSLNVFDGRTGATNTSGGTAYSRADGSGSLTYTMNGSSSSQAAWMFFTGAQATTAGTPAVSSGAWSNDAPLTLQPGDTVTCTETFSVGNLQAGEDICVGLWDSNQTRNTADLTGGQNDATFADDLGYGVDFFLSGSSPPFMIGKRDLSIATANGSLNNPFVNIASFPPLPGTAGAVMPAMQALANGVPYTFTLSVFRRDSSTNLITVIVSGGALTGSYSWQAIDADATQSTFDEFTGARFNGASVVGTMTFNEFKITYTPAVPVITAQPVFSTGTVSQTVGIGAQVTMTVAASGTGLAYQWYQGATAIAGATQASVTLSNLQQANAGNYTVAVSNSGGSVTSSALTLTVTNTVVDPPPIINAQPTAQSVKFGTPAALSVTATGAALAYQWFRNGTAIPGATSATLAFAAVQASDAGTYTVDVSNDGGTVPSAPALLTVVSSTLALNSLFPLGGAGAVCPDTHVTLTFAAPPSLGASGLIKLIDAGTQAVVDTIDLSSPRTGGLPVQTKTIGTLSNFSYYPVILAGNQAALYFRNGVMAYGRSYYITVDSGVFLDSQGVYPGLTGVAGWTFSTRLAGPAAGAPTLTVAADGTGDFATVQGAIDYLPPGNTTPCTIYIRKGLYTEIVYFTGKNSLSFVGEDRFQTVLAYANNNNFNSASGTYHRMVFNADHDNNLVVANLTIDNTTPLGGSQAEALIINGTNSARAIVTKVELTSYQDTLQINGQGYIADSHVSGNTDYMWGSGPNYFANCELTANASGGYYTQIRNPVTTTNHGNVYLNCTLDASSGVSGMYLGRIDPTVYPYSEVVYLNCVMGGQILPAGWLLNNATTATTIHFWEYNSHDGTGKPIDVSQRLASSAQLTQAANAAAITAYSTPSYVLGGGWTPQLAPIIASGPAAAGVSPGSAVTLTVEAVGVPDVSYQWLQNGVPVPGATGASLTIAGAAAANAGAYSVVVGNSAGTATSAAVPLTVTGGPPVITLQPRSQSALSGATASFNVSVVGGGPYTYQWSKNGAPIAGATGRSLLLTRLQAGDAAAYAVTVTNAGGTAASEPAQLTLVAPAAPVPTLPAIPSAVFDATTYGAVGDGVTDNTAALQAAINAAKAAGGGTVELPAAAAAYLCGPITLAGNLNFQVDAGALLQALPYGTYPKTTTSPANFITIPSGSTNVELSGQGQIDGNGAPWWTAYNTGVISNRPRLVQITSVTNLLITGLTFTNSATFHLAFDTTNNVTIFGVTVATSGNSPNTDGMDLAGANYLVQNCSVSDGDDNIVAKPGGVRNTNLVIANCTFGTGHGVSIGGQTNDGLNGLAVMNCTFNGTTTGLRFKADATEGGSVQNVTFTNITMTNVPYPILFYSYYNLIGTAGTATGGGVVTPAMVNTWNASPPDSLASSTIPTWQNITINNLTATGASGYSTIWGLPLASALIANVTLNHVNISGGAGLELYDATGVVISSDSNVGPYVTCNALAVTSQPRNQTVAVGGSAVFAVAVAGASGSTGKTPTFQWTLNGSPLSDSARPDGATIAGSATATLTVTGAHAAEAGSYACVVANSLDGYNVVGAALAANSLPVSATSLTAVLTVESSPIAPSFAAAPSALTAAAGATVVLNAAAGGFPAPAYQWYFNGTAISGATGPRLVITAGPAAAGTYSVTASNPAGASQTSATLTVSATATPGRLINGSALSSGDEGTPFPLVGFVSGGPETSGLQPLVVRAVGPGLQAFGVTGALPDPEVALFSGTDLLDTGTPGPLTVTVAPGPYAVQLGSQSGASGVALAEIDDATGSPTANSPRLMNLSCLQAEPAGGLLVTGFEIGGTTAKTVLIRAVGPSLSSLGVSNAMPDPTVSLFSGTTTLLSNAGWGDDPQIAAAASGIDAFPLNPAPGTDAAILTTLAPGAYTVQASSATGTAGVVLVEIYDLP